VRGDVADGLRQLLSQLHSAGAASGVSPLTLLSGLINFLINSYVAARVFSRAKSAPVTFAFKLRL
jgi:hypothetical protein